MPPGLVVAITKAIADVKDVKPTDLNYALEEFIPGDAIRTLESREQASWTLRFALAEHMVTVTSDGIIFVDGRQTISSRELVANP